MTPCEHCAKMLINAGITKIVSLKKYHQGADKMLLEAGIKVVIIHDELEQYDGQTKK